MFFYLREREREACQGILVATHAKTGKTFMLLEGRIVVTPAGEGVTRRKHEGVWEPVMLLLHQGAGYTSMFIL